MNYGRFPIIHNPSKHNSTDVHGFIYRKTNHPALSGVNIIIAK